MFRHGRVEWKESAHRQETNDCEEKGDKNGRDGTGPAKARREEGERASGREGLQFTPGRGVQTFGGKAKRVGLDVAFHVQTPRENNQARHTPKPRAR